MIRLRRKKQNIKKLLMSKKGMMIVVGGIATVYGIGVFYFSSHFLWNSTLNGINISGKTVNKIAKIVEDYKLKVIEKTIEQKHVDEVILGSDINIALREEVVAKVLKEQNQYLWFMPSENEYTVEELITIDEEALKSAILNLQAFDKAFYKEPVDAHLTEYDSQKGYEIVPEVEGNALNEETTIDTIKNAVLSLEKQIDLEESGCYKEPIVRSKDKDLTKQCELFNTYTGVEITYKFGENTERLNGDTIKDWVSVKDGEVELSKKGVSEYVASLRKKYDTIFRNREFMTSYGTKIEIEGGDYGWWMNYTAEADALYEMIQAGESGTRTPIYYQTAAQYGKNDYGDSYIEINLTAQHLFVYKDGIKVLESDFVSGDAARGYATPVGTYGITYKERDAVLVGETYETPVSYWMPFNKDVGLHDATWKNEFGKDFYKTDGSHGCINLPYLVAKQIYDYAEKGMAVICYELPGTESEKITQQTPQEIAQAAIDAINKIGTVTKDSKKKIERARDIYNRLKFGAKEYVSNYSVLVEAEKKFKALKK